MDGKIGCAIHQVEPRERERAGVDSLCTLSVGRQEKGRGLRRTHEWSGGERPSKQAAFLSRCASAGGVRTDNRAAAQAH